MVLNVTFNNISVNGGS